MVTGALGFGAKSAKAAKTAKLTPPRSAFLSLLAGPLVANESDCHFH
jgi:hypothetical protein